jgi:hypothetical protein
MPPRSDSLYAFALPLCRSLSQPHLYFGNDFLFVLKLLSTDCIIQRTENMVEETVPGSKVDEAGQSAEDF